MWSYLTLFLASFCLVLVIIVGSKTDFRLISPVSSYFNTLSLFSKQDNTHKIFGYIPGWSESKLDDVKLSGFDMLAFYDIPVEADGTLNEDTAGYNVFESEKAQELFQRAHAQGIKVVMTISQSNNDSIASILNTPEAQQTLVDQTLQAMNDTGVDGVAIDFAYTGDGKEYQQKFSDFVTYFKQQVTKQQPQAQVDVALNTTETTQSFYDVPSLASTANTLLLSMDNVALPEEKDGKVSAPVFGYKEDAYWDDVKQALDKAQNSFTQDNLALERAWYGNGDDYPMYKPTIGSLPKKLQHNTLSTPLSKDVVDQLVAEVPYDAQAAARKNIPLIAQALQDEGILTPNVLAYALATIEHETAGTFEPLGEYGGAKSARRLGYEGGTNYYGRGFIQLTHLRNYKAMGERIGMGDALVRNPELASDPKVAAKVLAAFFVDNGPAKLAQQGDFIDARMPINPDLQAETVAEIAMKYRYTL